MRPIKDEIENDGLLPFAVCRLPFDFAHFESCEISVNAPSRSRRPYCIVEPELDYIPTLAMQPPAEVLASAPKTRATRATATGTDGEREKAPAADATLRGAGMYSESDGNQYEYDDDMSGDDDEHDDDDDDEDYNYDDDMSDSDSNGVLNETGYEDENEQQAGKEESGGEEEIPSEYNEDHMG